jgi:hypothetical protein
MFVECPHGPCCGNDEQDLTIKMVKAQIKAGAWVFMPDPDSPCPIKAGKKDWTDCPSITSR